MLKYGLFIVLSLCALSNAQAGNVWCNALHPQFLTPDEILILD